MIIQHLLLFLTPSLSPSRCRSLTTFLQLLSLAASSADPLPAPTLSVAPRYHFYYEGEQVTLSCLAATKRTVSGFRFFNQSGQQIYSRPSYSLRMASFKLTATAASAGEYTCVYFVEDSGQEIPSDRSVPLSVKVQAAPTAPTLSLDPQQQVYRPGNYVKLLCSIPAPSGDVKEVQYYADVGFAVSIPVSNVKIYSYNLSLTGEELSGSYSCAYTVMKSERHVCSEKSRVVNVNVKSHKISWIPEIIVGASFFTINGLIFFFSHCLMKRREVQG
ncbi:alpha-1B-glycoprotein-like isoform X2 [Athene noctua]|uniref:alpha-1B-glycoprotein-like isoform X2 n=1 Tax=Athene noctua TaxID=126797 RepID=UPI003EB9D926